MTIDNTSTPPPTVPAAPPVVDNAPKDYQALYTAEVQARIAEREKYKPFAQTIGNLRQEDQQAILGLADAVAAGDTAAIAEWSASTYRNVTGAEIAAGVAAKVAGGEGGTPPAPAGEPPAAAPAVGMTPDQIAELVRTETAKAVARDQLVGQIRSELSAAGYEHNTPAGQTILAYAQANPRLSMADAIAWYSTDLQAQYARYVGAAAAAGGALPAPAGAPAAPVTGATSRDKALARLQHRG